jgi:NAD-dependent DNA ligase
LAEKEMRAAAINPRAKTNRDKSPEQRRVLVQEHAALIAPVERLRTQVRAAGLGSEVGPVVARSVLAFFATERGRGLLAQMRRLNLHPAPPDETAGQVRDSLSNTVFVLTGTLTSMSREKASDLIRRQGGEVANEVTRRTTFLVAGDNTGVRKTEAASRLGVRVIGEQEFIRMLDQGNA